MRVLARYKDAASCILKTKTIMGPMFNNIPIVSEDNMPEGPYLSFDVNDNGPVTAVMEFRVVEGVIYVVNEKTTISK